MSETIRAKEAFSRAEKEARAALERNAEALGVPGHTKAKPRRKFPRHTLGALITLRYRATCSRCKAALGPGDQAAYCHGRAYCADETPCIAAAIELHPPQKLPEHKQVTRLPEAGPEQMKVSARNRKGRTQPFSNPTRARRNHRLYRSIN